jgi:hypothetical protein
MEFSLTNLRYRSENISNKGLTKLRHETLSPCRISVLLCSPLCHLEL